MKLECICLLLIAAVAAVTAYPPYFDSVVTPAETPEPMSLPSTAEPPVSQGNPAPMQGHPAWHPHRQQQADEVDVEEQEAPEVESEVESEIESEIESEFESEVDGTDAPDAAEAQDTPDTPGNQAAAAAAGTGQSSGEQQPAAFIMGGVGGSPFDGIKQAAKKKASEVAGRTIGIILGALFIVVAAAVAAMVIIRKRRAQ